MTDTARLHPVDRAKRIEGVRQSRGGNLAQKLCDEPDLQVVRMEILKAGYELYERYNKQHAFFLVQVAYCNGGQKVCLQRCISEMDVVCGYTDAMLLNLVQALAELEHGLVAEVVDRDADLWI